MSAQNKPKPRGGSTDDYREAGRRAGLAGEPNRPAPTPYSREPWQRTAFRAGWAIGDAERVAAIAQAGAGNQGGVGNG